MSLSERINNKFEEWRLDVTKGVAGFLVTVTSKGIELLLDAIEPILRSSLKPVTDKILADPDTPPEIKAIFSDAMTSKSFAFTPFLIGMAGGIASAGAGAVLLPGLEWLKQRSSFYDRFQIFDFPIVLAAWLRDLKYKPDVFDDLRMRGYHEERIDALKQLVWLRLDPIIVQQIWPRDKAKYEKFWRDLHEQGWDDERIAIYKELAMILPTAQDLIHMAVREVFTPEIVQKYGQMQDFPPDFAKWAEKIGLTEQWAKNYWAAHWDLPSPGQGFEMLHRGVITYDELKTLLRALDVMPYWREKLIEIAYAPYTRVDVRRMYKEGVLSQAQVKQAYKDLGYNEERAARLTEFTLKTYARDEDKIEEEEEKIRDLTRADICDGYRRGMLTRTETEELLAKLAYVPNAIQFYLDREDLKKDQALRDAYATNYRQLFVIGLKDADSVKSEMTALGFLATEVDEYLKLWYIERLRREAKPSRTDLARFLKKKIITEERWRLAMADLGYGDTYIDWYRADME